MPVGAGGYVYASGENRVNSLDEDEKQADSSTWTGTETGALFTVTADLVNGERYELEFFGNFNTSSSAASPGIEFSLVRIREDTAAGTQIASAHAYMPTTAGAGFPVSMKVRYTAVATGSKTFVVTGQRISGAGNHKLAAASSRRAIFTLDPVPT